MPFCTCASLGGYEPASNPLTYNSAQERILWAERLVT